MNQFCLNMRNHNFCLFLLAQILLEHWFWTDVSLDWRHYVHYYESHCLSGLFREFKNILSTRSYFLLILLQIATSSVRILCHCGMWKAVIGFFWNLVYKILILCLWTKLEVESFTRQSCRVHSIDFKFMTLCNVKKANPIIDRVISGPINVIPMDSYKLVII